MQQFDQIIRLSGQQWWRSYYQQNVQDPLDRTDREMWRVQCNICDEYINPKRYDKKNISAADYFFCNLHRIMNIKVRFRFKYPLRHLIIQWSNQLLLNRFWSLYTDWLKIFQFFLWVFSYLNQKTTQKFKLRFRALLLHLHGRKLCRNLGEYESAVAPDFLYAKGIFMSVSIFPQRLLLRAMT